MTNGIGGVAAQRTPATGAASEAAEPSGHERPPEPSRLTRANAMPLRSRPNRARAGQGLKHSAEVDAHDSGDSHHDDGLMAMRGAGKFRLPGTDANRLKRYRTEKFVPSLSTVTEEAEAAPLPARDRSPLPLARPRLPSPALAPTQAPAISGHAASGPAAQLDIHAGAMADALRQAETQRQMQELSRRDEVHKAIADLVKQGGTSMSSGI
jgi:hypothetical protein